MYLQYAYRGSRGSLVAFVAFSLSTTPACTSQSDQLTKTEAEIAQPPRSPGAAAASRFTVFESGQVRPLALSADRQHLFAVNTPDNRLEVFRVKPNRLIHTASIPVGL